MEQAKKSRQVPNRLVEEGGVIVYRLFAGGVRPMRRIYPSRLRGLRGL
jgi:hypothetical protein